MKVNFPRVFVLSALLVSCGEQAKQMQTAKDAASSSGEISAEELSQDEMYLQDLVESAGNSEAETSAGEGTEAASEESNEAESEATVESDVKPHRLDQMVKMMLATLDTDSSGDLSLEEFLAPPKAQGEKAGISSEITDKIVAKLTQDFLKFAGEDKLLSTDEIKQLIKGAAARIGRHRCRPEGRPKMTPKEFIAKYDTDGDGKLSETEIAEFKKFRDTHEGREKPRHPGFGQMKREHHSRRGKPEND
jgi:EF hand